MIRRATAADLPAVSALWEMMVHEMRPEWSPQRDTWEAMAKTMLENPTGYTIFVDEQLRGFIDGMIYTEPSTGKVHGVGQHFYVRPEHRKGRTGGALYREMISLALEQEAEVLEFFCFPEELSFWGKRGYAPARVMVRSYV